jgi:hypothetical protein
MLALGCAVLAWSERGAAAERVITLFVLDPRYFERDLAAEERLRAELSAAGFTLKDQPSRARTTTELLEGLRSVSTSGSVAVLLENGRGAGYVWLEGQADVQRLSRAEGDRAVAADILALSVVELVQARALALDDAALAAKPADIAPVELPVVSAPESLAAPPSARAAPRWHVSADFGPAASPGMQRWGWSLAVAVAFAPAGPLRFELGAHRTLLDATSDTDAGTASLRLWDVRGYALWRVLETPTLVWELGAGAGPLFVRAQARAASPATADTTTTLVIAARSRLVWWLGGRLGLLVVVEPGIIAPPLVLFEGARPVAELGRAWLNTGLGVVLAL